MSKIDKKPVLEAVEEFQKHCGILQKLVNDLPVHPHVTFPDVPVDLYSFHTIKSIYFFNRGITEFSSNEKIGLKILVRRAIYVFEWSEEYEFLYELSLWGGQTFESNVKKRIEYLEYFDTLVDVAKKYKVLTGELVYITDKFNKEFKELRKRIEEWKQNNLNKKNYDRTT